MGSQSLSREWLDFAQMDLRSAEFLSGVHPALGPTVPYKGHN